MAQVAVKVAGVVTEYETDAFFSNAGTSPKLVYDSSGSLVWSPHNMFVNSATMLLRSLSGNKLGFYRFRERFGI